MVDWTGSRETIITIKGECLETLIELILFAAAAYGIKNYWFSPGAAQNREVFSSRGATFVKRVVSGQTTDHAEVKADLAIKNREEPVADSRPSPEPIAAEPSETVITSENSALIDESFTGQAIAMQQPEKPAELVPEDSILKRHYLAYLAAEQAVIKNPYPTDSVLRRHYDQLQTSSLDLALREATAEITDEVGIDPSVTQSAPETHAKRMTLPEDSVLKRHFLSHLRHEIEKQHLPCPTETVLKRHHRQLIQSRIDAYLAECA